MVKQCTGCREVKPFSEFHKDNRERDGIRRVCRTCKARSFQNYKQGSGYIGRQERRKNTRRVNKEADPRKVWAKEAYARVKNRAKVQGLEFDLSLDWMLRNTVDTCPLLGVPLQYLTRLTVPEAASIDKIDPNRGYTKDNCWIISIKANRIKTDATADEIEAVAVNIRKHTQ